MTIPELKQAIVDKVAAIDEDLRRRVYDNFQTRLQQCIDVNGGHLPNVQKISCNLWVINSILGVFIDGFAYFSLFTYIIYGHLKCVSWLRATPYKISCKSAQWEPNFSMQADGRTDITKLNSRFSQFCKHA